MFNSNLTPNFGNNDFDLFNKLNYSARYDRREKYTFHEMIRKDKKYIFNMYAKNSLFSGIVPKLFTSSKGIPFYNQMIKRAFKKGNYLTDIIEKISKSYNKNNETSSLIKQVRKNKLNEIELLKNKKNIIEKKFIINQKSLIKKNNSFILKPNTNIFNINNDKSNENLNNSANIKLHKIKIKPLYNINNSSKSILTTSRVKRIQKMNILLRKCKFGIKKGNNVTKKVENYIDKIHKEKEDIKNDENSKNEHNIIKLLEDNKKTEIDEEDYNDKYKYLEKQKIQEFKYNLNFKISDFLAYSNKKEMKKKIKDPMKYKAYELYLEDLNSINKEIEVKRKIINILN